MIQRTSATGPLDWWQVIELSTVRELSRLRAAGTISADSRTARREAEIERERQFHLAQQRQEIAARETV